jgi:hypothetical protein
VDCAFKVFRREVIDKLTIRSDNFFVCTELLAQARKWNFRILEKGVRHYPRLRGETTVRPSDIPATLREVARMWQWIYFPTSGQIARSKGIVSERRSDLVEFLPAAV